MILMYIVSIPLVAGGLVGGLALKSTRWSDVLAPWISLIALVFNLFLTLTLWFKGAQPTLSSSPSQSKIWVAQMDAHWIAEWGVHFKLGADGLSLMLMMLIFFLGIMSILASWREIQSRVSFFYLNLLWILAGITGVFLALDLFLFYFFWELMLVPIYFLIGIWGHENRTYAAIKFFLFTQASSFLMLLSILGLYFLHGNATGIYTFDYAQLIHTPMPAPTEM